MRSVTRNSAFHLVNSVHRLTGNSDRRTMSGRVGILERLAQGPVIGDGSMALTLEKRGYCKAGPWTPEAVVEYPEGVLQLHREFARAGADVIQTCSFYSSDDKLAYGRTDKSQIVHTVSKHCQHVRYLTHVT